jgi:N-glycosylase/DNA lyase
MGVVSDKLVRVSREDAVIVSALSRDSEFLSRYFSLDDDLDSILATFPHDAMLDNAKRQFRGLRLLTQNPWECLVSFICSINCNIPSIRVKIENLSRKYGSRIKTNLDLDAYSFPTPESLARANKRDLLDCRLGFRWKYVKFIAKNVVKGEINLEKLRTVSYTSALNELISNVSGKTFGVGPKVADCTLLYSLHKTEAFPIDVWILRCLNKFYKEEVGIGNLESLTLKRYFEFSEIMRRKFGKYAGYAQLYLYVKMREDSHSM